jgi:excinuclease ABC subunit A
MLSYRGKTKCNSCKGKRLRIETYVKINSKTVSDLVDLPIKHLVSFFKEIKLDVYEIQIARRLLLEINNRLSFNWSRFRLPHFK